MNLSQWSQMELTEFLENNKPSFAELLDKVRGATDDALRGRGELPKEEMTTLHTVLARNFARAARATLETMPGGNLPPACSAIVSDGSGFYQAIAVSKSQAVEFENLYGTALPIMDEAILTDKYPLALAIAVDFDDTMLVVALTGDHVTEFGISKDTFEIVETNGPLPLTTEDHDTPVHYTLLSWWTTSVIVASNPMFREIMKSVSKGRMEESPYAGAN